MAALINTSLTLSIEAPFDFEQTVTAHGWVALLPNHWNSENKRLLRIQQLIDGHVVQMVISQTRSADSPEIRIHVSHTKALSTNGKEEIIKIVRHMLRLDEDFSQLYATAGKKDAYYQPMMQGFGRLLRSPTVFEDLVKTICTTNIQWGGTKRMIKEIIDAFGHPFANDPEQKSFPSAQDLAQCDFETFNSKTNLGYRTDYIHLLARRITDGELDVESFLDPAIKTADLRKKLLAVKGIGNYAAATMLMLLGHYDALPVDSVFREFVFKKYFKGKSVAQARAEKIYKGWGKWKYLAYWYDMTR